MIDNGGPAFPLSQKNDYGVDISSEGMSLRDYISTAVLASLCSNEKAPFDDPLSIARLAYNVADAMLKARGEP